MRRIFIYITTILSGFLALGIYCLQLQSCSASPGGTNAIDFTVVASWNGPNNEDIKAVYQDGNNVYAAAGYSGLLVFDSALNQLGAYVTNCPMSDLSVKTVTGVKYAYITLGTYYGNGGVMVLNINDPTNLLVTNYYEDPARSGNALVDPVPEPLIMVADEIQGLQIYSNDWVTPRITSFATLSLGGKPADDIAVSGTNIFIAVKSYGIYVVINGGIAAQITTGMTFINALSISGNVLAAADSSGTVYFFDITTPAKPLPLGSYSTGGSANDVWLDGNDVYIADGLNGVLKVERTPPATYSLAKKYSGSFSAYKLFYSPIKGNLYVACGKDGIRVVK